MSTEKTQLPETVNLGEVLAILKDEGEKRRKNATAMRQVVFGIVGALLAIQLFLGLVKGKFEFSSVSIIFSLIAVMAAGTAVSKGHNDALKLAKTWQDPMLVPHLLEVIDANDEEIKKDAKAGLGILLPLVKEQHAAAFTPHQLKTLGKLTKDEDDQLAGRAVSALGRIGAKENLADLDALADAEAAIGKERPLQALALQARGDLRMRLAKEIVQAQVEPNEEAVKN